MKPYFSSRFVQALLLVLLLVVASCSKRKKAGDTGPAPRIVSLSPSTTEAVFAVGAGAQLVGRSRYCDFPPEAKALPQIGGYVDPSFEAILGLTPDLVVGARGPAGSALSEKLEARGIATYFPETESFQAIDAMLLGIGERTGRAEAARAVVTRIHDRIAGIESAVATLPKPRVLVVFGIDPLSVAGPKSFPDEMIRRAGGTNVISEGSGYPTIGVERVLALDPDVIVNAAMMEERVGERLNADAPGWSRVRAVQSGRVARLTDEAALRPGPRIAEGLEALARAIHQAGALTQLSHPNDRAATDEQGSPTMKSAPTEPHRAGVNDGGAGGSGNEGRAGDGGANDSGTGIGGAGGSGNEGRAGDGGANDGRRR